MRGKKYAVLICGDVATHGGFDEFWNDVVLMRAVLLRNGFASANIITLYGDGVDFSHPSRDNPRYIPSSPITDFSATTANVTLVFNGLANGDAANNIPQMTDDDFLFVWTFDHGTSSGGHALLCLRDANMRDDDFATLIDQIDYTYRVIAMQQCFSGGFVNDLANDRTVILTACSDTELANRAENSPSGENEVYNSITYHHGEFNFYLFSGLCWEQIEWTNVAVDTNLDRYASMQEVFNFIQSNDSRPETPQYDDGANNIGSWLTLERDTFVYIRDNSADTGMTPSSGSWWDSPDLWIRNSDDDGTSHQNPISGQTNYIYARIHNNGIVGSGPVTTKFFSAGFAGTEFIYPGDYNNLITWATADTIPAGGETIVKSVWTQAEITAASSHPCLLAEVYDHEGIPPSGNNVWESNNLGQKNLTIVNVFAGKIVKLAIMVGNANIDKVRPLLHVKQIKGPRDLKSWIEVKEREWLKPVLELKELAAVKARSSIKVVSPSRLRLRFAGGDYAEGEANEIELNLAKGSEIFFGTGPEIETVYSEEEYRWDENRVLLDLTSSKHVRLPLKLREQKKLYFIAQIPRSAKAGTTYVLDVIQKSSEKVIAGGVRFELHVR